MPRMFTIQDADTETKVGNRIANPIKAFWRAYSIYKDTDGDFRILGPDMVPIPRSAIDPMQGLRQL